MMEEFNHDLEKTNKDSEKELIKQQNKNMQLEINYEENKKELDRLRAQLKQSDMKFQEERDKWVEEKQSLKKMLIDTEIQYEQNE